MLLLKLFQSIVGILEEKLRVTIDINGMDIEADGVYGLAVNGKTRLLAKSYLVTIRHLPHMKYKIYR